MENPGWAQFNTAQLAGTIRRLRPRRSHERILTAQRGMQDTDSLKHAQQRSGLPRSPKSWLVNESEARELLILMFEHQGAKVKAAASSDEALKLLKRWRPAVLIADIGMPEMDGYQLIRHIRELPESDRSACQRDGEACRWSGLPLHFH